MYIKEDILAQSPDLRTPAVNQSTSIAMTYKGMLDSPDTICKSPEDIQIDTKTDTWKGKPKEVEQILNHLDLFFQNQKPKTD